MQNKIIKMSTIRVVLIIQFVCLLFNPTTTSAFTTQYYGNAKHEVLPNSCYHEDLDMAIAVNQTIRPTDVEDLCVEITCHEDYVLTIKHCDRVFSHRGCNTIPYDYSKAYPDCCYKVICA